MYKRQVPIQADWDAARLVQAFTDAYREKFGNTLADIPVTIVNLRTVVIGVRSSSTLPHAAQDGRGAPQPASRRPVHFGRQWHDTPVYLREQFAPGMTLEGPAIVEQSDTTTVIEPDMGLTVDKHGNLLVRVKGA